MGLTQGRVSVGTAIFAAAWVVLVFAQLLTFFVPNADRSFGSPKLLFTIVVPAALSCVVASVFVLHRAWQDNTAELGILAAYFMAVSMLPLVHGLTAPGVLFGPNEITKASAFWALPVACIAALPLFGPAGLVQPILQRWRVWVVAWIAGQSVLGTAWLVGFEPLPSMWPSKIVPTGLAIGSLVLTYVLSTRQLRLYRIGQHPGSLAIAVSFAAVASGNLVWLADKPMTPAFWFAHALEIVGVTLGALVALVAYRRGRLDQMLMAPLIARTPLEALPLAFDPIIRRFIADLEHKDEITSRHVARTAELAMKMGEHIGVPDKQLRQLGLGALLHDVGKLEIDDAVLKKAGKLTDEEFEHIKTHTVIGERLVNSSPELANIGQIVRHHHERIDGRGYPDRLSGSEIPKLARIVSVCDAYDAMTHTRQYRTGMNVERTTSILREHAGSQWDAEIVDALLELIKLGGVPDEPTVLGDLSAAIGSSCIHELPLVDA